MAGGRPTKYSKEMLDKSIEYLTDYGYDGDVVPTAAGLACYLGVNKTTLYEWAKENIEFSNALGAIHQKQESLLVNKSLMGDFNPTIAKLMMHNHGYSDKQEITGNNGGAIETVSTIRIVAGNGS
jgi:hypothetical protein